MSKPLPVIRLKPGREKAVLRKHPWIFSGAVHESQGELQSGDSVAIQNSLGEPLGLAAYSAESQIRCRMWDFETEIPEEIDSYLHQMLSTRLKEAYARRLADPELHNTNSFRLIHAESDQVPGLIVDFYAGNLVVQFLSWGVEARKDEIVTILNENVAPTCIFERSDQEVRKLEGLSPVSGVLQGALPAGPIVIDESGLRFSVDIQHDQKTGHYLDQRQNRETLRKYSRGKKVLDCFSGTGGFGLNALLGGADSITAVDSSSQSLKSLLENCQLNDLDPDKLKLINQDVFQYMRTLRDQGESFDVVILDPPKFAPTRRQVNKASRAYKDINLLAMKLLRPGGLLFTFSCSGGVDANLFQQIVAGAALDSGADFQIIGRMQQASDHPVLLSFPEGDYLKGVVCKKI